MGGSIDQNEALRLLSWFLKCWYLTTVLDSACPFFEEVYLKIIHFYARCYPNAWDLLPIFMLVLICSDVM